MNGVPEVHFTVLALSQPSAEHGFKVAAACGQHGSVARERTVSGMQQDISEEPLLTKSVQMHQHAVSVRGLVEQIDVHGARAGTGLAVLVDADRHFH